MPIYAIEYRYEETLMGLVSDFRAAHREFLRGLERQEILLASGFLRDVIFNGALLILRADSAQAAEELLADDPFSTNGLIHSMVIREWQPTIGSYAGKFDTEFPHS